MWHIIVIVSRQILKAIWKSRHFFMIFLSSIQGAFICILEKMLFDILEHPSISISKKIVLMKILKTFPLKHPLFEYICRPSRWVKDHSPWKVHVRFRHAKKACLRNLRHIQKCVNAITCLIWWILNQFIYFISESEIHVALN